MIQIRKKSGFLSHFQLSHMPKTYILNNFCSVTSLQEMDKDIFNVKLTSVFLDI